MSVNDLASASLENNDEGELFDVVLHRSGRLTTHCILDAPIQLNGYTTHRLLQPPHPAL